MNPMKLVLMQLGPPNAVESAKATQTVNRLDAIQQYFQRPGTGQEVLLALLVAVSIVLIAVLAQSIQRRRRRDDVDRPAKLFRRLLHKLDLTVPQRDILRRMASDLRLDNATVLLLSRSVFERHARRWLAGAAPARSDAEHRLADLTGVLYPTGMVAGATSTIKGGSPDVEGSTASSTTA